MAGRSTSGARTAKRNTAPSPSADSTLRSPPIRRTNSREIVRPRPVPACATALSACTNGSKMRSRSCSAMPVPVSRTEKTSAICPSSCASQCRARVTLPCSMNLSAFDSRFNSTWRSLAPSRRTSGGTFVRSSRSMMPCSRERMRTISSTSSSRPFKSTGPACNCMRPASIFDSSRMSLIKVSKWWPARLMMARLCFSSSNMLLESAIICEKPITEFRGVRNSWLMLARKTLFARLADSASVTATDRAAVRCCTSSSRWSR
ncbi:hypothetical protein JaAD80_28040 [Janthinobacterium sp. AD80]|nr:hypothetical protein JaAD80_28040 [Janthinobacterium sp. AD80]